MKKYLLILLTFLICPLFGDDSQLTIKFYVVSKDKIPNGVFVDKKHLPKLGYIKKTPDLELKELKNIVFVNTPTVTYIGGKRIDEGKVPNLWIYLLKNNFLALEKLTEKNLNKRLLLVIGNDFIIAPRIMQPIKNGIINISLFKFKNTKLENQRLKKLIIKYRMQLRHK